MNVNQASRPASVTQRKAAKDLKEEIVRASLDMRETLKRTLHCKDDDLDDLIKRTDAAKEAMRERSLLKRDITDDNIESSKKQAAIDG